MAVWKVSEGWSQTWWFLSASTLFQNECCLSARCAVVWQRLLITAWCVYRVEMGFSAITTHVFDRDTDPFLRRLSWTPTAPGHVGEDVVIVRMSTVISAIPDVMQECTVFCMIAW